MLTMDRTNWKFAKTTDINVLLLGVTYKNVAFPLSPKRGNSNTAECIEIIERFIDSSARTALTA